MDTPESCARRSAKISTWDDGNMGTGRVPFGVHSSETNILGSSWSLSSQAPGRKLRRHRWRTNGKNGSIRILYLVG